MNHHLARVLDRRLLMSILWKIFCDHFSPVIEYDVDHFMENFSMEISIYFKFQSI